MQIDFEMLKDVCKYRYGTVDKLKCSAISKECTEENCPLKSEYDISTCGRGKKASFHFCSDCFKREREYGKEPF